MHLGIIDTIQYSYKGNDYRNDLRTMSKKF